MAKSKKSWRIPELEVPGLGLVKPGTRVRQAVLGEGMVIAIAEWEAGGHTLQVDFGDNGVTWVSPEYAHLQPGRPPRDSVFGVLRRWLAGRPPVTRFNLFRDDLHLGVVHLVPELCDFPWYGGLLEPEPIFASFAPLFAQELELLREERMDEWGRVLRQIEGEFGLSLMPVGGGERITGFHYHLDGDQFTWRT